MTDAVRTYWNQHIHDLEIARHPVGSREFFRELDEYRFDKLDYLPSLVDFASYEGKQVLEVGCGLGIDLLRFARGGAHVVGIDLSEIAILLAQQYFQQEAINGDLLLMNGEAMAFDDNVFDVVYAHGVLQYTADPQKMVREIHRVLKPAGTAILMVYNRYSWLSAMSRLTGVELEHEDAPAFHLFSANEFRQMLPLFESARIVPERFPVETRLHQGLKAKLYNGIFVGTFNALPQAWTRPFGWHLMAFAVK